MEQFYIWHGDRQDGCISRIPDQNGISLLYIMLEIHHSGREPSVFYLVMEEFYILFGERWDRCISHLVKNETVVHLTWWQMGKLYISPMCEWDGYISHLVTKLATSSVTQPVQSKIIYQLLSDFLNHICSAVLLGTIKDSMVSCHLENIVTCVCIAF